MALTFTGATGTTSATIPSHSAGDLIIAFAYRDGSNTVPSIPSGQNWTTVFNTGGANTNSHVVVAKVAASSSEATGTFTNATSVIAIVVKTDVSGGTLGYKNGASGTGASTTLSFTGFTLDNPTSSSRIVAFAGHRSTNTTTNSAPTGFTNITSVNDATDEAAAHRSTSVVSSFSTTTQSVGGTSSGWRTHTLEVWEVPPDTTAPTLTSPTGTEVGADGYSGTVTTDEANGTLYYWVTQNSTETAANVVSNGATQAITTTGVKNVSGTGLSASTTYYIHYVHVDAASNQSTRVSSSSFTTGSGTASLSFTATPSTISSLNATALGAQDWKVFVNNSPTFSERKSGGGNLISELTTIGSPPFTGAYASGSATISWLGDGLPTATSSTSGGVYYDGLNCGGSFTLLAGVGVRTSKLVVGVYDGQGKITLTPSDASSPPISYTFTTPGDYVVDVSYSTDSASQTILVEQVCTVDNGGGGVTVQFAWVSSEAAGGPTTIDLTKATLSTSAKAQQNKVTLTGTTPTLKWSAKAVATYFVQAMTKATLSTSPKAIQNKLTATTSVATLSTSPKTVQNKTTLTTNTQTLSWSAKALQNIQVLKPTAAILSWSAKAIDYVNSSGVYVMELTAAILNWSAKAIQNRATNSLTLANLNWSAKAVQNKLTAALSLPTLKTSAKVVQNLLRATLSAAQIKLTAQVFSARLLVTLTATTMASWSAKALQMLQRVSLTRATFNFQPLAVEFITEAVIVFAKQVLTRLSRFRKLLKQRRY